MAEDRRIEHAPYPATGRPSPCSPSAVGAARAKATGTSLRYPPISLVRVGVGHRRASPPAWRSRAGRPRSAGPSSPRDRPAESGRDRPEASPMNVDFSGPPALVETRSIQGPPPLRRVGPLAPRQRRSDDGWSRSLRRWVPRALPFTVPERFGHRRAGAPAARGGHRHRPSWRACTTTRAKPGAIPPAPARTPHSLRRPGARGLGEAGRQGAGDVVICSAYAAR